MLLYGNVKDKNGNAVSGANVEVKDEEFQTIYQTLSDAHGAYSIDLPPGKYPFVVAVKDYGIKNLEYWCQNIYLAQDLQLDIRLDTLEIYGLHVFSVKGAYPSLMVYFRPMSLEKYKKGDMDICPTIKSVHVFVNSVEVSILEQSKVLEYIGDRALSAFLLQVEMPKNIKRWNRVDIEIRDNDEAYGMASIFAD